MPFATPLSVLDLAPVVEGGTVGDALHRSRDLAQHAERWNYRRFWLAEHHNMPGIASAATSLVIQHVAAGTSTIRVGAGGIMLPNHAPLVIAEQFGTLDALFPGRIDLGLGRAPGTDHATARALRRTLVGGVDRFPEEVGELMHYFREPEPGQTVRAFPGVGAKVPVWILGSSLYGAQLAARMGLPYAFASHFAPGELLSAIALYRQQFQPSAQLDKPYVMVGVNVIAADTDEEARFLLTSLLQAFVNLRRGRPGPLKPPVEGFEEQILPHEAEMLNDALAVTIVGGPERIAKGLQALVAQTKADELICTAQIFEHAKRLRSFELAAQARDSLAAG